MIFAHRIHVMQAASPDCGKNRVPGITFLPKGTSSSPRRIKHAASSVQHSTGLLSQRGEHIAGLIAARRRSAPKVRSHKETPRDDAQALPSYAREDMEDYFLQIDGNGGQLPKGMALSAEALARLCRLSLVKVPNRECTICLQPLTATAVELPCAAKHAFHSHCLRRWLARSAECPLCRENMQKLVTEERMETRRTYEGGHVLRHIRPPASVPRPSYIPPQFAHIAELLEVRYPQGIARLWRVPQYRADGALPVEIDSSD